MQSIVAAFAIVVACLMAAQWAAALRTGRVPELATRPAEIRLHLLDEFLTAAVLATGGTTTIGGWAPGRSILLLGLGMLTYTAIVSPGYFIDRRERGPVVMFAAILALTAAGAIALVFG